MLLISSRLSLRANQESGRCQEFSKANSLLRCPGRLTGNTNLPSLTSPWILEEAPNETLMLV